MQREESLHPDVGVDKEREEEHRALPRDQHGSSRRAAAEGEEADRVPVPPEDGEQRKEGREGGVIELKKKA